MRLLNKHGKHLQLSHASSNFGAFILMNLQTHQWLKLMDNSHNKPMEDNPHNKPMDNPYNKPMDNPHDKPMNNPHNKPMDNPHDKPMDNLHNKPMDNPHDKPMYNPHNKPMDNPHNKPMDNPHNKPMLKVTETDSGTFTQVSIKEDRLNKSWSTVNRPYPQVLKPFTSKS
eukprot:XP_014790880.1 PREDICTED: serine-rich 25 kDa antigen protein-like [Octopus bimaculoides]